MKIVLPFVRAALFCRQGHPHSFPSGKSIYLESVRRCGLVNEGHLSTVVRYDHNGDIGILLPRRTTSSPIS
jgi:hypothetical protein